MRITDAQNNPYDDNSDHTRIKKKLINWLSLCVFVFFFNQQNNLKKKNGKKKIDSLFWERKEFFFIIILWFFLWGKCERSYPEGEGGIDKKEILFFFL